MKKFLFGAISLVLVFSLVACGNKKVETMDDEINNTPKEEKNSNIASLEYDSLGNPYVKLSDSYYFDNYKEIEKREILPTKIYLVDDGNSEYSSKANGDINISLPIEKCETLEEERIEYAEYGIEKMLHSGVVRIGNTEIINIQPDIPEEGYDYKEDILYYMDQGMLKIYEVSLDENDATKELLVYSRFEYPWDSFEYPYLVKIENDLVENMGVLETENLKQLGSNRNILTDGWNSDIEGYFSNVLMGYYVYDDENGLIHVKKMADGDNISDIDVNKLNSCILNQDVEFGIMPEDNIYADKGTYSTWALGPDTEIVTLPRGTELKVVEIVDDYGNFIAETMDGTRYCFFSFAGRP